MSIIKAIILGILQGITEFLPISSSGHLLIAEQLMDLSNDLVFSLILHVATLLAVVIYYWEDCKNIIKYPKSNFSKSLFISFIPTIIIALIVKKFISDYKIVNYMGFLFILTGVILLLPKIIKKRSVQGVSLKSGFIVGVVQGVACIPGISRSGATITAARFCGFSKEESVKFSFLQSIPIIIGGILYELFFETKIIISSIIGFPMFIGFIVAFVVGVCAIKIVSKLALNDKFYIFSIYLFIIGLFTIVNNYVGII